MYHNTVITPLPEDYAYEWKPFLGTRISLTTRPLIPRPETEYWTELAIKSIQKRSGPCKILDLCSGSGCIGIATLFHCPNTQATFADIDATHFRAVQSSLALNNIDPSRAQFIQSDVYDSVNDTFDFILSNPPYLAEERIERVDPNVLEHEPRLALFADEQGFAIIRKVIRGAISHLNIGGELWIEHEPEHEVQIHAVSESLGLTAAAHKDQYGIIRYTVILKS